MCQCTLALVADVRRPWIADIQTGWQKSNKIVQLKYICVIDIDHTRAFITRGLYTFYPLCEVQKRFFQGAFFLNVWPYVWLVFKSGFKSRAGYDGARTVLISDH